MEAHRIEPLPGFTPIIGRLVAMLELARQGSLSAVRDLSIDQLDRLHDARSNSIGALLAHVEAVERWYQILTFEDRRPVEGDDPVWLAALDLGEPGRRLLRGRSLASYLEDLAETRARTLRALAERDDGWLERPLPADPEKNAHWAWFHVAEDEIGHCGQIRWLRARL